MAVQALMDLPLTDKQKFVLRKDMQGINQLKEALQKTWYYDMLIPNFDYKMKVRFSITILKKL